MSFTRLDSTDFVVSSDSVVARQAKYKDDKCQSDSEDDTPLFET